MAERSLKTVRNRPGAALLVLGCALCLCQMGCATGVRGTLPDNRAIRLVKLLPKRFGQLTPAEEKLVVFAIYGALVDCSSDNDEENDPAQADTWGEGRTIRADLIRWLCVDHEAAQLVDVRGIWVKGARIDGYLDLSHANVPFALTFWRCGIPDQITLRHAEIRTLNLLGTYTGPILASELVVRDNLFLADGFRANGQVRLDNATIGGRFNCNGGTFINEDGHALDAAGITVEGSVLLGDGFEARGEVRLLGATIGGQLRCNAGTFINEDGYALSAGSITVDGNVFLGDEFKAKGEVRLYGANLGGQLSCSDGIFINENGPALNACSMIVLGSVFLADGFEAQGEVRLFGTTIEGQLNCSGGTFNHENGRALSADGIRVDESVKLDAGFEAQGEVRFAGADIGGQLVCDDGTFINPGGVALMLQGVEIHEGLFLRGDLHVSGTVNLTSAKVGRLVDDRYVWDQFQPGQLILNGFEYGALVGTSPTEAEFRIKWLELQPKNPFRPQPYEQLATVLRDAGHEGKAKKVLIAKQERRREYGEMGWWTRKTHWVLGVTIGYGYRAHWALYYLGGFLVLGSVLFGIGKSKCLIWPTDNKALIDPNSEDPNRVDKSYPALSSLMYALDSLIPIVDLHQQKYWLPNIRVGLGGRLLCWYLWLHIIAGWFFTTMLILGVTGLVRQD